jgi:hypothetical protein
VLERSLTYQPAGTVSRHDVHEGGFARPRGTHDGRQLAGFELPRHALRKNTLLVKNTNKKKSAKLSALLEKLQ